MINAEAQVNSKESTANKPLRICIQGGAGAFHEIAARHFFEGQAVEIIPANTFEELVQKVEQQEDTDMGLMAIENTLAGSIMPNYGLLEQSDLWVSGEVYLRIKQNLMVFPGQNLEDLEEVHSHYMAIAQCREFFRAHPHIHLVECEDTALSAKRIRDNNHKHIGAIASTLAAELYELDVIASSIETNKKNHTRFWVLDKKEKVATTLAPEKVSLCFTVDHTVGSLYKVLAILAAYNVNLTKIQSTPIVGKPWEYFFFLDFLSTGKFTFDQAIEAIRPLTHNLKILGAYPQGKHFEY